MACLPFLCSSSTNVSKSKLSKISKRFSRMLKNNKKNKNIPLAPNKTNNNTIPLKMIHILQTEEGFELFKTFCSSEYCIETLLFILEVAEYKRTIKNNFNEIVKDVKCCNINDADPDPPLEQIESIYIPPDLHTLISEISSNNINIPLDLLESLLFPQTELTDDDDEQIKEKNIISDFDGYNNLIINENDTDINSIWKSSKDIFFRYIITTSPLSINLSYQMREDLLNYFTNSRNHQINNQLITNDDIIKHLYIVYDRAFTEMYYFLKDTSFYRFVTQTKSPLFNP